MTEMLCPDCKCPVAERRTFIQPGFPIYICNCGRSFTEWDVREDLSRKLMRWGIGWDYVDFAQVVEDAQRAAAMLEDVEAEMYLRSLDFWINDSYACDTMIHLANLLIAEDAT